MAYHDDILDVYAYLRSKSRESLQRISQSVSALQATDRQQKENAAAASALQVRMERLRAAATAYARQNGVDASVLDKPGITPALVEPKPMEEEPGIQLPEDFDFAADFQRLVEQAHAAGFQNTRPESLLSDEELQQCLDYSRQLDVRFADQTGLREKDIWILCVATAVRVALFYATHLAPAAGEVSQPLPEETGKQPAPSLPADSGVDYGDLLGKKGGKKAPDTVVKDVLGHVGSHLLDAKSIISNHTAFDVEETDVFSHEDILGYDKFLGWLFGVANILTDTVTTKNLRSYSLNRLNSTTKPMVRNSISTLADVLYPVLQNGVYDKQALVAAIFREAMEQGVTGVNPQNAGKLIRQAIELEEKNEQLARKGKQLADLMLPDLLDVTKDVASIALVSVIVSSVHAMVYDPREDGSLDLYSLRTRKIIAVSGVFATTINSMRALAVEDWRQLDFGGLITTLLELLFAESTWIQVKADFLTQNYAA